MTHSTTTRGKPNSCFSLCPTELKLSHLPSIKMKAATGARTAACLPHGPRTCRSSLWDRPSGHWPSLSTAAQDHRQKSTARPCALAPPTPPGQQAQGSAEGRAAGPTPRQVALGRPRPLWASSSTEQVPDLEDRGVHSWPAPSAPPCSSPTRLVGSSPEDSSQEGQVASPSTPRAPTGWGLKERLAGRIPLPRLDLCAWEREGSEAGRPPDGTQPG